MSLPAQLITPSALARLCVMVGYSRQEIADALVEWFGLPPADARRLVAEQARRLQVQGY